eukprot:TRINITY_DN22768_c0_g1_i1.p1 TRINITY_DN22768_c0_g1~~TRINITY_DN22768_c0_g1_i1.p1  ORF type:complete len:102 (-),score=9.93 TRINITY_DN22768_c0_g1_i1:6-311(-)
MQGSFTPLTPIHARGKANSPSAAVQQGRNARSSSILAPCRLHPLISETPGYSTPAWIRALGACIVQENFTLKGLDIYLEQSPLQPSCRQHHLFLLKLPPSF